MQCGMLFENEQGIIATCILPDHDPVTGHCDGEECYFETDLDMGFTEDFVNVFYEAGVSDLHGMAIEDAA